MERRFGLCVLDGGEHAWLHAPLTGVLHDAAFDHTDLHERMGGKDAVCDRIDQLRESAARTCEHKGERAFIDRFHRLLVCALYCGGACGNNGATS